MKRAPVRTTSWEIDKKACGDRLNKILRRRLVLTELEISDVVVVQLYGGGEKNWAMMKERGTLTHVN